MGANSPEWSLDGTSDNESLAGSLSRCSSNTSNTSFDSSLSQRVLSQQHSQTSSVGPVNVQLSKPQLHTEINQEWPASPNSETQSYSASTFIASEGNTTRPPPAPRNWLISSSNPTSGCSSPDSIFSLASSTSSTSSTGSYNVSSLQSSGVNPKESYDLGQRRTTAQTSWSKPTLVRQEDRRRCLVGRLVDSATALVAAIWPESEACRVVRGQAVQGRKSLDLQGFVQESLRRSNTSYTTLQLTLWYLVLISSTLVQDATSMAPQINETGARSTRCGRRMFLSALILASKFIQDRNYTARAWSKITGLPATEITENEFAYLNAIDWNLHMREHDFIQWNKIVVHCTDAHYQGISAKQMWTELLAYQQRGFSLELMSKLMMLRRATPSSVWPLQTPILYSPRVSAFLSQSVPPVGTSILQAEEPQQTPDYQLSPCVSPELKYVTVYEQRGKPSYPSSTENFSSGTNYETNSINADTNLEGSELHDKDCGMIPQSLNGVWLPTPSSLDLASSPNNSETTLENEELGTGLRPSLQSNESDWLGILAHAAHMKQSPPIQRQQVWSNSIQLANTTCRFRMRNRNCMFSRSERKSPHPIAESARDSCYSTDPASLEDRCRELYSYHEMSQEGYASDASEQLRHSFKRSRSVTDSTWQPAERQSKYCRSQVS